MSKYRFKALSSLTRDTIQGWLTAWKWPAGHRKPFLYLSPEVYKWTTRKELPLHLCSENPQLNESELKGVGEMWKVLEAAWPQYTVLIWDVKALVQDFVNILKNAIKTRCSRTSSGTPPHRV